MLESTGSHYTFVTSRPMSSADGVCQTCHVLRSRSPVRVTPFAFFQFTKSHIQVFWFIYPHTYVSYQQIKPCQLPIQTHNLQENQRSLRYQVEVVQINLQQSPVSLKADSTSALTRSQDFNDTAYQIIYPTFANLRGSHWLQR